MHSFHEQVGESGTETTMSAGDPSQTFGGYNLQEYSQLPLMQLVSNTQVNIPSKLCLLD